MVNLSAVVAFAVALATYYLLLLLLILLVTVAVVLLQVVTCYSTVWFRILWRRCDYVVCG